MKHYVFGYGSLICQESRAVTAEALGSKDTTGIPVRVLNWVRAWNIRGPNTYLGVQRMEGNATDADTFSCVGVLCPLPSSDDEEVLKALDKRERGYTRQRLDLASIMPVMELLIANESSNDEISQQEREETIHDKFYKNTFLDNKTNATETEDANESEVCVWIYVPMPQYTALASTKFPILQSYVDICMKGCLSISKAFTKEFVQGTYGWYPGDSQRCEFIPTSEKDESWDDPLSSCWVGDRKSPVYVRADKEYALENADALDEAFGPSLTRRRHEI